jgi:hypothetical protein
LFLRIPSEKKLAVFDPNEARVVQNLRLDDSGALFAGGAAKLFVYLPKTRTIERYDLISWAREQTAHAPAGLTDVDAIAVGAGSDGPVYLLNPSPDRAADVRVLDATTLGQTAKYQIDEWRTKPGIPVHIRASDDGTVLGATGANGAVVLRFGTGGSYRKAVPLHGANAAEPAPMFATPSPDEQHVFTPRGVYLSEGTRVMGPEDYFYSLPTDHGNGLFLSLDLARGDRLTGPPRLHLIRSRATTASLSFDVPDGLKAEDVGDVTPDQRIHLWPAAGLAAVLPSPNDRIELHAVNLEALLKSSTQSYLVIGSDPPANATRGKPWQYHPLVWASAPADVRWQVLSPAGMQIGRDGLIWIPPGSGPSTVEVHLRATMSADVIKNRREIIADQKFRIAVTDEPGD